MEQAGGFLNSPRSGEEPLVLLLKEIKSVPCTPREKEPNDDGGYKFCRPTGNTSEYSFENPAKKELLVMRSASQGIFYAFKGAKVMPGEYIRFWRTGEGRKDTRYHIEKLTKKEVDTWVEQHQEATAEADAMDQPMQTTPAKDEEIRIEDIPF